MWPHLRAAICTAPRAALSILCCLAALFAGGCCLTNHLWSLARDQPESLSGASITADEVLHMDVRYRSGEPWRVVAPLPRDEGWSRVLATRTGRSREPLPPSVRRLSNAPVVEPSSGLVSVYRMRHEGKDGTESHTVWVSGEGYRVLIRLPAPLGWNRSRLLIALLASPTSLIVDLATVPVWLAWNVATAGGHGPCWIPWCDGGR